MFQPFCVKESFKSRTWEDFYNDEPNEVVTSFKELYGKLATANLRAKAKKLAKVMTEEERKEVSFTTTNQMNSEPYGKLYYSGTVTEHKTNIGLNMDKSALLQLILQFHGFMIFFGYISLKNYRKC